MTAAVAETETSLLPPLRKQAVMEDRKRPLIDATTDETPPSKRQAMATSASAEPERQEDVINFQKEAIYRQMKQYKREKELVDIQIDDLKKRCKYHDDHLRIIDAFWEQVMDEVRVLVDSDLLNTKAQTNGDAPSLIPPTIFNEKDETFRLHLQSHKGLITSTLTPLFQKLREGVDPSDVKVIKLQKQVSELLAAEKSHKVELERINQERDDAEEQLTMAAMKYLQAEKKLDRLKSQTVAKIEQQLSAAASAPQNKQTNGEGASGAKHSDGQYIALQQAKEEAEAVQAKQEQEIKELRAKLSTLEESSRLTQSKLNRLSEDDIISCDTYKNARARLDDVVARFNHLEALNNTLVKENESLTASRTQHRQQLEQEQAQALSEANSKIARCEADLARIRGVRDSLVADNAAKKSRLNERSNAEQTAKAMTQALEQRIASLESEISRLKLLAGETELSSMPDIESLSQDELLDKMKKLHSSHDILVNSLGEVEAAYRSANALCKAKTDEVAELNEALSKVKVEVSHNKMRGEHKLYEAGRAVETTSEKIRMLHQQTEKASQVISNLKDSEKAQIALTTALEKQVGELRSASRQWTLDKKTLETNLTELKNTRDALEKQLSAIKDSVKSSTSQVNSEAERRLAAEKDLERTRARVKFLENQMKQLASTDNDESTADMMRTMIRCTVCKIHMKSHAIKLCGHVFCKECVEERIASRNRKCPNCARPFAQADIIPITL